MGKEKIKELINFIDIFCPSRDNIFFSTIIVKSIIDFIKSRKNEPLLQEFQVFNKEISDENEKYTDLIN